MRVCIVSPIYNEESGIENFVSTVRSVVEAAGLIPEFILVNDGSTDNSLKVIRAMSERFADIKYISFVRNYGHQAALCAGLARIEDSCDVVITMDSDLEHPPSLIPELVKLYELSDSPIINTKRAASSDLPFFKRLFSSLFYRFVRMTTGLAIDTGFADFRLYDASILRQLRETLPTTKSLRLLSVWLVPTAPYLEYAQTIITDRVSRFSFRRNISFAINSIISFSELPGVIMGAMSLFGVAVGLLFGLFSIIAYIRHDTAPGWTSLVGIIIFFSALNLGCLSMLFLYLSRHVFRAGLPSYVIYQENKLQC